MEYKILGKTGLRVSSLGFGGIPIQRIDAAGTKKLMHILKDAGVNYIDTARGYTVSEEFLGEALEGIREHFILATKSMARDHAAMARDIEISLRNLRTDFIELYQVHNPTMAQLETVCAPGGALQALLEAKQAGKIGHIGITTHALDVFEKALELPWVETIMFPYNIVENQGEHFMKKCREKNIAFIAMKPMAGGAIESGSLALRYIRQNDDVTVVIPGIAEQREALENIAAWENGTPLTPEEEGAIREVRRELGTNFCRRCNYCQPCAAGINISGVFLFEGYLSRYGLGEWAKGRYEAMPVKASACIGCGACEDRCPYHLPIRRLLKAAAEKFGE